MPIKKENEFGKISINEEAIAQLCGAVVTQSYGIVGVASQQVFRDGLAQLLNKENYSKGVIVKKGEYGLEIDVYVILAYGIRVSEVINELQNRLFYELDRSLQQDVAKVNVYVQQIKKI